MPVLTNYHTAKGNMLHNKTNCIRELKMPYHYLCRNFFKHWMYSPTLLQTFDEKDNTIQKFSPLAERPFLREVER